MDEGAHAASAPRPEFVERVRALYGHGKSSGWGSVAVSLCLVIVMWRSVPPEKLLAWLALVLSAVAIRIPLLRGFRADDRREGSAALWARRYRLMVLGVGLCWAAAPFLMLRADDPFGVALYLMVLALVCAGNIASQSVHPPAVRVFLCFSVLPATVRLALFRDTQYAPVILTLILFFFFLLAYADVHSRQMGEAIRLKLENLDLIEALRAEKGQAEALRTAAEQANAAKSQFLVAASHDLRQPLHALGLFSAALHEMAVEPEKQHVVENIFASIDALELLFNELLDLSRLDAGYIKPQLLHAPLAHTLERLQTHYQPLAEGKGLTLSLQPSPAVVYTDPTLLERILGNLIANGIQYTEQGTVSVTATPVDGEVIVEVRDTGAGIPEQYRERIFEEFFQLTNPERDRRKGLGLGLAIVRRMSAMLGVTLSLQSEEGKGCCFSLRLLAGDHTQVDRAQDAVLTSGDVLSGKTILVIDDETSVLHGMQALLAHWGCEVLIAADADEAVATSRNTLPDLVVADLRLPQDASGRDAIERVCAATGRRIPALIITGDTAAETLRQTHRYGYALLHKPLRPVKLRAALSQLLAETVERSPAAGDCV